MNVGRTLYFQANIPLCFLGESLQIACYLINHFPTPLLKHKSPYELLHNKSPYYSQSQVFGCLCYATNLLPKHKFDVWDHRCVFFCYPPSLKGYRLYDLDIYIFFSFRDVVFHENIFSFSTSPFDNPDDFLVQPTTSHDPLLLPESIPLSQAHPALTLSDSPFTSPYHPHVAINDAPSSSPPPISSPPLPILSSPFITIYPPHSCHFTSLTKPPPHFKYYQAHHVALFAASTPSLVTSATRYPITRYVSHFNFSAPHRIFINNIS